MESRAIPVKKRCTTSTSRGGGVEIASTKERIVEVQEGGLQGVVATEKKNKIVLEGGGKKERGD